MISFQNPGSLQEQTDLAASSSNIQLILGSYRSGKTDLILNGLLRHCKENALIETIVVVPSARYRALLEKRIFKLSTKQANADGSTNKGGIVGLRLLTFYEYCQLILNRAGVYPRTLPDSARLLIVQKLLQQEKNSEELAAIAKLVKNPGATQAMLELIDELQRASLSPKDVRMRLETTAGRGTPQLSHARIYEQYWQMLESIDYLDEHKLAYKILELTSPGELSSTPSLVAFDGFDRFNPLQLQVIAASARICEQIIVSFDYLPAENDPNGEYEWKRKTYDQLIAYLQPQQSFKPSQPATAIALNAFSGGDRYLEMSQIASLVKQAIVERSVKRDEILVVIPRVNDYGEAAEAAFFDVGVDCFVDAPAKMLGLPLVQFLIKLLSLKEDNFVRANLISCLQSPFLNLAQLGLTKKDVQRLETISYKQKIIAGEKQWLTSVESDPFDLKGKLQKLFQIVERAPDFSSAYEFVSWVEDTIEKLVILPEDELAANPFQLWLVRAALAQIRDCLASMLADENVFAVLEERTECKYKIHLDKLTNLIESGDFPLPSLSKESVLICTAEKAPNRSFDEVYIAGLVEGEFPRRSVRRGLLTSDEVSIWETHGIELHNPRFEPGFEIALLTGLKERARKRVILSSPQFDIDGEELTPAFAFTEELESGRAKLISTDYFENELLIPVSARSALTASAWCGEEGVSTSHPLVSELDEALAESTLVAKTRDNHNLQSVFNGNLQEQTSAGVLKIGLPEHFSASQLGKYGSCPHQYWLSYVVKAKLLEEPEEGLNTRERGSAYHRALELFYAQLISANKAMHELSLDELEPLAKSSIRQCLSEVEKQPNFRSGEFWHYQKLELEFRLWQFLKYEHYSAGAATVKFKPLAVEASFGYNQSQALSMKVKDKYVSVRGRIDRIDEEVGVGSEKNKRLRVIDYKTGQTAITAKDQKQGIDLQLPLYALAVQRSIFSGSKVTQGQYLSVHGRKSVGSLYPKRKDGEPEVDPLDNCEQNVEDFVQKIEQGNFIVSPTEVEECQMCDHKSVCRVTELTKRTSNVQID